MNKINNSYSEFNFAVKHNWTLGILKSSTKVWFPVSLIISDLHCQAWEISKGTYYIQSFLSSDPNITELLPFHVSEHVIQSSVSTWHERAE